MAMVQKQRTRVVAPESAWRSAVRRLGRFTKSELAAELRCSVKAADSHVKALLEHEPPMLRQRGYYGRKPMYEYLPPTDAGRAFEIQSAQRDRATPESLAPTMAVERPHDLSQSKSRRVSKAPLRKIIAEAKQAGWTFVPANGSSKARLVKDGRTVLIPETPRNATNAADNLRKSVFGDPARFRVRGRQNG